MPRKFINFKLLPGDTELMKRMAASKVALLMGTGTTQLALATQCGIPIGTVKSRTHRARAELVKLRAGAPQHFQKD